jgi:hypothetical protein
MSQDYPTLNSLEPSWADISFNFPIYGSVTVTVKEIAGIKWNDKVEVGVVRGANGGRKTKRTTGLLDNDASMTCFRSGWKSLRQKLAAKDKRISLVGFDIIIQHTPPGDTEVYNVKIAGCRIVGRSYDTNETADPDKIELALNPMVIEEDGITLL